MGAIKKKNFLEQWRQQERDYFTRYSPKWIEFYFSNSTLISLIIILSSRFARSTDPISANISMEQTANRSSKRPPPRYANNKEPD